MADIPIRVVGGDVKNDSCYISSWEACNSKFNEADDAGKVRMLRSNFVHFKLNEGIPPQAVHEAHMAIPEYRDAMVETAVIRPPEDDD